YSGHGGPRVHIFHNRANRRLFIASHEMACSNNYFNALWAFLLLDKWLQFIQRTNLVEFAGHKQLWTLKGAWKTARGPEKGQANDNQGPYTLIKWCVKKRCIGSKAMSNHTHFG